MKCNVGKTDKVIRIVAGLAIIAVGIVAGSWWGLIGLVPLLTGLIGWCPAYLPFKINTQRKPAA
jgi:hypothetical protein